ncbi:MAG TPA: hypothetical protein DCY95_12555 [Algoriphagus sp.]|nr:hypothetical protein [Algoriphagus sp.]MAL16062.1 hypothetical protein [Algoriphagus sp.]MAN87947.1 hypothetical protein [Algoriphagus sp.]HAH39055.1 hypothetical protein [Algoriphagus sp.]HAS58999.1 hypothetical protein [Algoriphagus sp.]
MVTFSIYTLSCTWACAPQAWLINYALSELLIQAVFKVYFATGVLAPRNLQFRGPIVGFSIRFKQNLVLPCWHDTSFPKGVLGLALG